MKKIDKKTNVCLTTYRKMCEPHADDNALNAAMEAFHADVCAAREKHRIVNVSVVMEAIALNDGEEQWARSSAHIGDPGRCASMLAWAFADAQHRSLDGIRKLMSGGGGLFD